MKEKLIIIIKLSLRKKENRFQKGKLIANLGNKNNSSKKEKKKKRQLMASFLLQACLLESWQARWRLLWRMLDLYP